MTPLVGQPSAAQLLVTRIRFRLSLNRCRLCENQQVHVSARFQKGHLSPSGIGATSHLERSPIFGYRPPRRGAAGRGSIGLGHDAHLVAQLAGLGQCFHLAFRVRPSSVNLQRNLRCRASRVSFVSQTRESCTADALPAESGTGQEPETGFVPSANEKPERCRSNERQYEDGSDPQVLDIIDVPVLGSRPNYHQAENWLLDIILLEKDMVGEKFYIMALNGPTQSPLQLISTSDRIFL